MLGCTMQVGRTGTKQIIIFSGSKIIQKEPCNYLSYPYTQLQPQPKSNSSNSDHYNLLPETK